jgi:hypothetical protein
MEVIMKGLGLITIATISISIIAGCASGIAPQKLSFFDSDFVSSSKNNIDVKVSNVKSYRDTGWSYYVLEINNSMESSINVSKEDISIAISGTDVFVPLFKWKDAIEDQRTHLLTYSRLQSLGTGAQEQPVRQSDGEVSYESGFLFGEIPAGSTKKGHIRFNMDYVYMNNDLLKKLNTAKTSGVDVSKGVIRISVKTINSTEEFSFPVKLMYREVIM